MAKRRRLTPARPDFLLPAAAAGPQAGDAPGPLPRAPLHPGPGLAAPVPAAETEAGTGTVTPAAALPRRAPISQIAGDAATAGALEVLAGEMGRARQEGRLVLALPLAAIDADHLVRDRMAAGDDAMAALVESLRARGQQTPLEVVALEDGTAADAGRYGLISGWRRLTALRHLWAETGEPRFATALCLLRRPDTAAEAYVAMVEENEIRVGLSHYERARIAARAVELGVYASEKAALLALFATASRAKRSKIRSFLPIYHALDPALRFATAIPERLGLALAQRITGDAAFGPGLVARLAAAAPATAPAELALLAQALRDRGTAGPRRNATAAPAAAAALQVTRRVTGGGAEIVIAGPGATAEFAAALSRWIAARGQGAD